MTLIAALAIAAVPSQARAASPPSDEQAIVTSVVDGDSLWVRLKRSGQTVEVRLLGIDAPEICQAHGPEARRFLADLVLRQPVRLVVRQGGRAHDRYGRTLGTVIGAGGEVNERMVVEGHAWSIRSKWDRGPYVSQERVARALKRGLHQLGSAAVQPKDFRRQHGRCR